MKSLLEFKQTAIKIKSPNKGWEDLYQSLIELFKEWGVESRVDSYTDYKWEDSSERFNKNFERVFISGLIKHVLQLDQHNPIWRNIFKLDCTSNRTESYHGSYGDNIIESYEFQLRDKQEVLSNLSGEWVFNHYDEVKDFLDQYNDKYIKLFEINRLFPIDIVS